MASQDFVAFIILFYRVRPPSPVNTLSHLNQIIIKRQCNGIPNDDDASGLDRVPVIPFFLRLQSMRSNSDFRWASRFMFSARRGAGEFGL